tara:strand:- start:7115 stop:7915 length:801 start_codon:yes stop_codon:yes gene_type:complete
MAKGKAQLRRVRKLGKLLPALNQQLSSQAGLAQGYFMNAIQPEFNMMQNLARNYQTDMLSPFTATTQGQGFLNTIEQQSEQARQGLADRASLLGMSDESVLAGQQNIAKSEGDRMNALMQMGESSKENARRGFGNIIANMLNQRRTGYVTGLNQSQGAMNTARGIQQQAGEMAQGVVQSVMQGAETAVTAFGKSDIRLKKNITKVGKSNKGHNIYTFEYIDKEKFGHGLYKGVMAQELESHSVRRDSDGYYSVNYDTIDVNFERIK